MAVLESSDPKKSVGESAFAVRDWPDATERLSSSKALVKAWVDILGFRGLKVNIRVL